MKITEENIVLLTKDLLKFQALSHEAIDRLTDLITDIREIYLVADDALELLTVIAKQGQELPSTQPERLIKMLARIAKQAKPGPSSRPPGTP